MGLLELLKNDGAEVISDPIQVQRAYAYIRVSHEDSADRATSLETQRRDIERYAASQGIDILEWFEEPGKSAFKDDTKRTEFVRMLRLAKENSTVSLVLVWKSDRFSRNRYQAATAKGELAKAGIRVLSILEPYDSTTTSGIVLESVTDAMNQIRSIEIGQVTHKNLLVNCEMRDPETGWAYKNGGWAQFGYKNHRVYVDTYRKYQRLSHCIWLLDEEITGGKSVHEWARTMLIEWRLKGKLGADAIARHLTQEGVPTPSGRTAWSDSTINCLLMPERLLQYAGYGTWNKVEYRNGGKRQKDRSEWKIIEKAHPAIISEEEAEAIHEIRVSRSSTPGKRAVKPSPYILSGGLLRCSRCGANYMGQRRQHGEYYVCGAQIYRHGADCGRPWYIRREVIEGAVFECIEKALSSDADHLHKVVAEHNKLVDSRHVLYESTKAGREAEVARLEQEIENLMRSVAEGVSPAAVKEEVNKRVAQRDRLRAVSDVDLPRKITLKELKALSAELCQKAESRDPGQKRIAVRQYIAALAADPERRTIRVLINHPSSFLCTFPGSARGSRTPAAALKEPCPNR